MEQDSATEPCADPVVHDEGHITAPVTAAGGESPPALTETPREPQSSPEPTQEGDDMGKATTAKKTAKRAAKNGEKPKKLGKRLQATIDAFTKALK
jgi:hypothetical protein